MSNDEQNTDLTEVLFTSQEKYPPSEEIVEQANVPDYEKAMEEAAQDPVRFWEQAAEELEWFQKWEKPFDDSEAPFYKWFVGGKCNLAYNALDRHIQGENKDKPAIRWEDETGRTKQYTYQQLYEEVNKLVNALRGMGVEKGDRVAIYMPNIPEIAMAMLACAKIGAMHSVVYAGFSAKALADRINDASAKVLFTADGSFRRGKVINLKKIADNAAKDAPSLEKVVVVQNNEQEVDFNEGRDVWFHDFVDGQPTEAECEEMDAEDPAFVLYTSGTTSKPKGVVHVHGGYPVGVLRTMKWVFDVKGDEVFWCTADPGWITGHSYIIYGPLLAGITTLQYEGVPDTPEPDRIWSMVENYEVNILYTAPTLIRAMMKYGSEYPDKHDMPSLRILGSVGEPINPEAWKWYHQHIGKGRCPIMDTWWQTETGMNMVTPLPTATLKPGSACKPFPGIIADVVDSDGNTVQPGKGGYLVIKNQWPSMIRTIFNNPERYVKTYFQKVEGAYFTGDVATKDEEGYFWIQGRTDDVLKVAGHRIGTAEVESAFVSHDAVVEAGVIGVPDQVKGEVIKAFVILKQDAEAGDELKDELKKHVRSTVGPVAVIKDIEVVDKLPKTRSGKIMRRVLKAQELGQDVGDTSAMAN